MERENFEKVIKFTIDKEEEAAAFYEMAEARAENLASKKMFQELAMEEVKHKRLLLGIEKKPLLHFKSEEVPDLKIGNYLVDMEFSPKMTYQEILILAIKREEMSLKLYQDMGKDLKDEELKNIFQFLANQESKHKLRLETEYDEYVLTED